MKTKELIVKRGQIGFGGRVHDKWLEDIAKSDEDVVYIILPDSAINRYSGIDKEFVILLREKFKLKAMFDLGSPLIDTNVKLVLYVFSKHICYDIVVGILNQPLRKLRRKGDVIPLYYEEYLSQIDNYLSCDSMPTSSEYYEINKISNKQLDFDNLSPNRYSKDVFIIEEALKSETVSMLSDVAEILRPRPTIDKRYTDSCLKVSSWQYPLPYEDLVEGVLTDTPIQKGDIIFLNTDMFYLVDEELKKEIHVSPNFFIIRPTNISSAYLALYLKSDTAKIIIESRMKGTVLQRIAKSDLEKIPVVVPKGNIEEYEFAFKIENYRVKDIADLQLNNYKSIEENYRKHIATGAYKSLNDIFDIELVRKLKIYKQEEMQELLDNDFKELNACFSVKAYKATLILAGSILEAVLIDWLSELHQVNYFKVDYKVTDSRTGKLKKAELFDYINEIKYIERPNWMEEAGKAHQIRKKRNLVHAKLCMNSDEINESVCKEVISYLKDVLKTRGIQ